MMKNLANDRDYFWPKEKFLVRFDAMRDIYLRSQNDPTHPTNPSLVGFQSLIISLLGTATVVVDLCFRTKIPFRNPWRPW